MSESTTQSANAMEIRYCGEIDCEQGLAQVAQAIYRCSWNVRLVTSGFDGTQYLRARSESIDLEMDSGQESPYLFSGAVDGGMEQAKILLSEISCLLSRAQIRHRIEVYQAITGSVLELYLHHDWPR